jgi:hypothetical protein
MEYLTSGERQTLDESFDFVESTINFKVVGHSQKFDIENDTDYEGPQCVSERRSVTWSMIFIANSQNGYVRITM